MQKTSLDCAAQHILLSESSTCNFYAYVQSHVASTHFGIDTCTYMSRLMTKMHTCPCTHLYVCDVHSWRTHLSHLRVHGNIAHIWVGAHKHASHMSHKNECTYASHTSTENLICAYLWPNVYTCVHLQGHAHAYLDTFAYSHILPSSLLLPSLPLYPPISLLPFLIPSFLLSLHPSQHCW